MTTGEMIGLLLNYPHDTKMIAWDADSEAFEEVTGLLHSPKHNTVRIETDDIS